MTLNFDVFGAVTGALGLFGLVPIIYTVVQSQLPSRWQKSLDEILGETETIWREALEEGLFVGSDYTKPTEKTLSQFRHKASNLRAETHRATSFMQQFKGMVCGLSRKISLAYKQIKDFRAELSSTTAEERRRLLQEGRYIFRSRPAVALFTETLPERLPTPLPVSPTSATFLGSAVVTSPENTSNNDIPRPHSNNHQNQNTMPPPPETSNGSDATDWPLTLFSLFGSRERVKYRHVSVSTGSDSVKPTSVETDSVFSVDGLPAGYFSDASASTLCEATSSGSPDSATSLHADCAQPNSVASATPLYQLLCYIQADLIARGQHHPLLTVATEMVRSTETVVCPPKTDKGLKTSQETDDCFKTCQPCERAEADIQSTSCAMI